MSHVSLVANMRQETSCHCYHLPDRRTAGRVAFPSGSNQTQFHGDPLQGLIATRFIWPDIGDLSNPKDL